jgi:hypothetical protein
MVNDRLAIMGVAMGGFAVDALLEFLATAGGYPARVRFMAAITSGFSAARLRVSNGSVS